ncbi:MAG: primosomal protein N' [Nitrospirota bacterium]
MEFLDILFPLKIGQLTYKCSDELLDLAMPGMVVSAPLKNKIVKGIIMGKTLTKPSGKLKEILDIYGDTPALSDNMIKLLKWMSEYYLAAQGLVLKNILPKEAFTKVKQRGKKPLTLPLPREDYPINITDINDKIKSNILESINKNTFNTFLLHAPSTLYEYSFLLKILEDAKNVIILVPEIFMVHNLYPVLTKIFGERVCIFHSGISRGNRSAALEKIITGYSDIVLGTRSAIFAPLKKVSFIAVIHEHSNSYKQEGGLYFNSRDIAVKRGYFENATVLLSSICPSIESLYNCKTGKYIPLKPVPSIKKPGIRLIDMRNEKLLRPYLSKTVVDASSRYIKNNRKAIFVINRRGYSIFQCTDCNHIEKCPACKIPFVFHKQDMSMKCHYCGNTLPYISERCSRCKGYNIKLVGAGTQRVQEDIEELIGTGTVRIDSDRLRKKSEIEGLIRDASNLSNKIIIGTKLIKRGLGISGQISMAAILNTDLFLNIPDFRSAEKTFQEISSIIDKIAPDGEIFIQTKMPRNYLFKHIKNHDYLSFFKEELYRRKSLLYPPYSKLLLIKFISKRDISPELSEIINKTKKIKRIDDNVEILGPSISKNQGKNEFKLLLKSPIRGSLHSVAMTFIEAFKDSKDVKIKTDIDPILI